MTTTIEATPKGWWYSARLPRQKRVTIFFSDGSLLSGLNARSNAGFAELMSQTEHIRSFLRQGYITTYPPTVVLADTSFLTRSAGDGWCAAGDAASALDPLASAGIVNGINAGTRAASLVLSGFRNVADYSREIIDKAKSDIEIRRSYYRMESRWPQEHFWLQRRES
jgi:flavin-dependent dehydrogenase